VHLQNLMSHGFITTVELTTCNVLEDSASFVPAEGYMLAFMTYYQRGFGVPSH
jgi:hypothetical protein